MHVEFIWDFGFTLGTFARLFVQLFDFDGELLTMSFVNK